MLISGTPIGAPHLPPISRQTENCFLHDFCHILTAKVTGNPTPAQLSAMETHLRDLNLTEEGSNALRNLRQLTEVHRWFPLVAFDASAPDAIPVLQTDYLPPVTAPRPSIDEALPRFLSQAGALRHFQLQVDSVARLQLELMARAGPQPAAAQASGSAGPRLPEPARRPRPAGFGPPAGRVRPRGARPVAEQYPGRERQGAAAAHRAANPAQELQALIDRFAGGDTEPLFNHLARNMDREIAAITAAHRAASSPPETMSAAIQLWTDPGEPELPGLWADIDAKATRDGNVTGALAFRTLLGRLAKTSLHKDPASRAKVADWLRHAARADRQGLRDAAFEASIEGTATCDDNILHTWNKLLVARLKDDVKSGWYAGRVGDLYRAAQGIFRMDELDKIIQAKVMRQYKREMPENSARPDARQPPAIRASEAPRTHVRPISMIDALETSLMYQTALRETLDLPLQVSAMYFPMLSGVTREDIDHAAAQVRGAEEAGFAGWLLLEFDPFRTELKRRLGAERCADIQSVLDAKLDGFDDLVAQRLRDLDIPDDDESRREMGVRLSREIQYEVWRPYADAMLREAGLPLLPDAAHAYPLDTAQAANGGAPAAPERA
jgi:hypothetical protein